MRLRALAPRERVLVAAGGVLLVLAGLSAALLLPLVGQLHALRVEVTGTEEAVARLRGVEAEEPALDRRLEELRARVAREGLDPEAAFGPAEAIMLLEWVERTWGLNWEEISFTTAGNGTMGVKIAGTGPYDGVCEFLRALRRFPRTAGLAVGALAAAGPGVRLEAEVTFQANPVEVTGGPVSPAPPAPLEVPPLPSAGASRRNPFAPVP